jgi:membrane-bound ClpP family serine protease
MILALLMAATPVVAYAELTGSVDPGSGHFLIEAIKDAQDKGVEALLVRLDTPGGLLSTTREVVQAELSAKVPIIFWVGPPGARAGSACPRRRRTRSRQKKIPCSRSWRTTPPRSSRA